MNYLKTLIEAAIPNRWRPRVEIYVLKDNKILVGVHPEIGLHVPGGGIETGQNIYKAAEAECLEEAGVKIKNVKLATKENYYEDWYKLDVEGQPITKKDRERMKIFRGIKHFYLKADFDGFDKRLLGSEGDALKKISFIGKNELIKEFIKQGKKFDKAQYDMRIKIIKSL